MHKSVLYIIIIQYIIFHQVAVKVTMQVSVNVSTHRLEKTVLFSTYSLYVVELLVVLCLSEPKKNAEAK